MLSSHDILLITAASIMGRIFPWVGGVLVQYVDSRAAMLLALPATLVQLVVAFILARKREANLEPLGSAA